MPTATDIITTVESLSTLLVAAGGTAYVLHRLGVPVPVRPLAKLALAALAALGSITLLGTLWQERPRLALAALLPASLASFGYVRWQKTRDVRSAFDERVRHARGQERRRAPGSPPAAGSNHGHALGATRPVAGGPP